MDRIYKIGGHCFALPDERLMEAVDGISGFKPFVWQPDLVSVKDVYEGAWLPDFTVWEGNGWDFPAFQRKSYGFGYEDVTGTFGVSGDSFLLELAPQGEPSLYRKYSINSLVYWVTYVHNVVYSFYRSMIYCYINSTQRCAGSIVIDIIPTNGADKRKFFPFAPYFPVTNVIKRYFYPYFPAIIGIKGYSFPYFPYLSGIMKIKTALYSLFSRLDWHKTVVFPCLGEIYEGIRSLSWEIPVT